MLQVVGICIANAVGFYLIFVYVTTWLKLYAQMKIGSALLVNSINMAIMLGVILGAGWLSDKIGRKPVMAAAAIGMALFAWPLMALMQTGDFMNVFLGQLGFVLLIGSYNAVNPIAICELFPRSVRCSAVSTAYNITLGVVGGTAPIVATWLIDKTTLSPRPGPVCGPGGRRLRPGHAVGAAKLAAEVRRAGPGRRGCGGRDVPSLIDLRYGAVSRPAGRLSRPGKLSRKAPCPR